MTLERIRIARFNEISGEEWDIDGPISLSLAHPFEQTSKLGLIPADLLIINKSNLSGLALESGEGALGITLPEFPIPDERLRKLYDQSMRQSSDSVTDWVSALQSCWVFEVAEKLQLSFFRADYKSEPSVEVIWNPDAWSQNRIAGAQIIMKGIPNDHPYWQEEECDVSFDL